MPEKETLTRIVGLTESEREGIPTQDPVFSESMELDREAGSVYIRFHRHRFDSKIDRTESVNDVCNFDFNSNGFLVGIEILNAQGWVDGYFKGTIA